MSGYTRRQAERLKHQLDLDLAKAEDAALAMIHRVSDHSEYVEGALDELREVHHALCDTVDRRTSPERKREVS